MKNYVIYLAVTGLVMSLCACGKTYSETFLQEETEDIYQAEPQTELQSEPETMQFIQPTVQPNERTTHNENDVEKDRLLAFFNDEVPVTGYPLAEPEVQLYYGDIRDGESEKKQDESCCGIMDVTGNGEREYIFYNGDTTVCMVYDDERERFNCLLFWDTKNTFFLGDGQVLVYHQGQTNVYAYKVYDENGSLTEFKEFAITLTTGEPVIQIDGKDVTEDTWKKEFDWIMDLYHTRPVMMTFEDLTK